MKKRILAFVMSMLLIVCTLLTLASCKDDADGNNNQSNVDIPWLDNLGDHDLGGYTVKFAVGEAKENDGFNERSIVASSDSTDRVDGKIIARNKNIENRFNCKIKLEFVENANLTNTTVRNVLASEGDSYDVIAGRQFGDVALCSEDLILELTACSDAINYIDIKREYWGTRYIKGMTYKENVYWITGDLNLRYTGGYYSTFVNAALYNNYLYNEYGDIHDIVRNGNWTVDKLQEMSDKVAHISAESKPGSLAGNDIVGVAFPIHDNTNGLAVACGVQFSKTNKSGDITFNFTTRNTTLMNFYKEYIELINSKGCMNYFDKDRFSQTGDGGYIPAFADFEADQVLFVFGRLNQAELCLRNAKEGAFYILPNPKLNEDQEEYRSSLHDAISIYGINPNSSNIKATAIVLEAMAAESYRTVRPEYYGKALGNKYTRDENTKEMIEILSKGAYSDFALVWAATTYFKGANNGLNEFLRTAFRNGTDNISTDLSAQGPIWETTSMKNISDAFAKIGK